METDRKREDEWFLKNEKQLIDAARAARQAREQARAAGEAEQDRQRLRELHFMKCPKCGHDLKSRVLDEVTIDQCSFCEGIYLDAGELDQLFLKKVDPGKGLLRKLLGV